MGPPRSRGLGRPPTYRQQATSSSDGSQGVTPVAHSDPAIPTSEVRGTDYSTQHQQLAISLVSKKVQKHLKVLNLFNCRPLDMSGPLSQQAAAEFILLLLQ